MINGEFIRLRPLKASDWDDFYSSGADPEVWALNPQKDRYKKEEMLVFFHEALISEGAFAIVDSESGKAVGSTRFYDFQPIEKRICIGYTFIARKYWGGPVNRELKFLLLRHAFDFVNTVHFEIGEINLRSRMAIEKIGAELVRIRNGSEDPFSVMLDGYPHVIYSIDKFRFLGAFKEELLKLR